MKKFSKVVLTIVIICLALAGVGAGTLSVLVMTDVMTSFDPDKLGDYSQTTWVFDRNDEIISGVYGTENRTYIKIDQIPKNVRNAFIAAEDVRFYTHHGIDPVRIFGALAANIKKGSLSQGASTITQQLIKGTHLTAAKTYSRKIEEAILALKVERSYTKDQILEMYLNYVYFGNGAYGIQMAAYKYFDKEVSELTLTEAAALAATLKAPSNYAPHIQAENNKKRRASVLSTMEEQGFITAKQAYDAKQEDIKLADSSGQDVRNYSWYVDAVLMQAEAQLNVGSDELMEMGLRIYTAMDNSVQKACDEVFENQTLFPANSADDTLCQSALVIIDSSTGEVLAMEGGRKYEVRKGFNRALSGARQPGSVLKPLAVYAPALERRIVTPATVMLDSITDFSGYSPRNYGDKYYGNVTLRTAVAKSLNVPPTQLLYEMGSYAGYESLVRFHMNPDASDTGLSLAVGSMTRGATPIDLCAAYASLSSGGTYRTPVLIRRIEDNDGNILYEAEDTAQTIIEPSVAYVLTNLLQSVTTSGTGRTLNALEVQLASKTGTVGFDDNHNRDVWSAAYTPNLAAVCWMGFDTTNLAHSLDSTVTGGKNPTTLLYEVLSRMILPKDEFVQPEGVVWAALDSQSMQEVGQPYLAGEFTAKEDVVYDLFIEGTQPTVVSDIRITPQTPWDLAVLDGENGYPLIEFTALDEGAVYHIYRTYNGSAHEIAQVNGIVGSKTTYLDNTAQRLYTYDYFIIAEFPATGIYGTATNSVNHTVPLLPFHLPWE